ncbi:ABC transporter permease [Vagococcus coleopterorum]|uniref:ABC transporter permease n=1 Tax=Vagococcus coleopterorum TaxID=2714946 RepID=A0A6G8APJ5_9ENTE|nr:ABC transporter permease [Vagococcus coleopterorum]QIL46889.1 ABC transporter permease [Vagococcus coleopterorum]
MNFLKRAWASITRRKGKSLILFAVIFVLGNVLAGAISIQQTTTGVEKNIKKELGGRASIAMDSDLYEEYYNNLPEGDESIVPAKNVSEKTLIEMGNLPQVKYFDYSVPGGVSTREFKMYSTENDEESHRYSMSGLLENYFVYTGVNSPEFVDMKDKKIELTAGRIFTDEEVNEGKAVAIVSKEVAELNNLAVNDKMVIDASGENYLSEDADSKNAEIFSQKQVYQVIGIYDLIKKESEAAKKNNKKMGYMNDGEQDFNTIYMPNKTVSAANKSYEESMYEFFPEIKAAQEEHGGEIQKDEGEYYQASFILNSPEESEAFKKAATDLLPDKYSKIIVATDQYDNIAAPVKNMSKMATYVIFIAIAATILILSLVVILFLRDRKHELGIYLSLGERRVKILGQIVIEVLIVAFIAITLSVVTGNVIAKNVSQSMVETQLNKKDKELEQSGNFDFELMQLTGNEIGSEQIKESYQVKLSLGYVVLFYLVGIGTVLLSTVIPLSYILRLNPKKIMM